MSLVVSCGCGRKFAAKNELAGKTLACPSCGNQLQVPQPPPVIASCNCGSRFTAPAAMAGKQVACPNCKRSLTVSNQPVSASSQAPTANLTDIDFTGGQGSTAASTFVAQAPRSAPPPYQGPSVGTIIGGIFGLIGAGLLLGCVSFMYLGFFAVGGVPDVDLEQVGERYSDRRGVVRADEGEENLLYKDLERLFTFTKSNTGLNSDIPSNWKTQSLENNRGEFRVPPNVVLQTSTPGLNHKRYLSPNNRESYEIACGEAPNSDPTRALALARSERQSSQNYQDHATFEKRADFNGHPGWLHELENPTENGGVLVTRILEIRTPRASYTMTRSGTADEVRTDADWFFSSLVIDSAGSSTDGSETTTTDSGSVAIGWKTYEIEGGYGTFEAPANCNITMRPVSNNMLDYKGVIDPYNGIGVLFVNEKISDPEEEMRLQSRSVLASPDIRTNLISEESGTYAGYPSWDYKIQLTKQEGDPILYFNRWIVTPHGSYRLLRSGPPEAVQLTGPAFLNSLVIQDPASDE